ncbi:hypothetical protein EDD63_1753 [Breznakia blatticola]|uniref:Uncharacterized protein n=1 Tax=Breznakia blatticola TaxID=1754012 RepID=A0A4R7Z9K6_9FIRM|nr:hypothetical protein [Breznakia blatticola]TDW08231.1 hypothetical protein EDD63_1753 [Breznakia blatticola]
MEHNNSIKNINNIIDSLRLDCPNTDFTQTKSYAYIDFTTEDVSNIVTPYGPEYGGSNISDPPFTGTGFTGSENGTIVPEW